MNLRQYENKKVRITAMNGAVFEGAVTDYISPEDNEPEGIESIVIDSFDGRIIEFPEGDIQSIAVIP